MAAGTFTILNKAKQKLVDGTMDLDSHTFNAALATNAWSPSATYVGTSTNAQYSDVGAAEVANGNGYTTGGKALTGVALSTATGTVTWTSSAPSWSASTFSAKYLIIYDFTATNKDILGYMDLETTVGTGVSPSNGTLTVNPNASGWFTLA